MHENNECVQAKITATETRIKQNISNSTTFCWDRVPATPVLMIWEKNVLIFVYSVTILFIIFLYKKSKNFLSFHCELCMRNTVQCILIGTRLYLMYKTVGIVIVASRSLPSNLFIFTLPCRYKIYRGSQSMFNNLLSRTHLQN